MDNSTIGDMAANVRYYFDRDAAKQALKEKYEAKMLFAYGDGMWKAGPELLSVLHLWHGASGWADTEAVLLDEYGNPCKVDVVELWARAKGRWQEQMNAWHEEFESLRRER